MIPLDTLRHDDFAKHEGETFLLPELGVDFSLILQTAAILGHHHPGAKREAFSLLFRGPAGCRLPQRIYRLEHPSIGAIEIFLTQVAGSPQGSEFEAIFT
jgi:hypothetical protein